MKKYILCFITLSFIVLSSPAQKIKDALYLKNGSIIYGKLLEVSDGKYNIQTSDGSLFIYSTDEVAKFTKESPQYTGRKTSGAGFALEAGLLIGSQHSEYTAPFSFNFILNYTAGIKDIMGIGSGVEFLGTSFTPFFLEYKHLLCEKKTAPFVFFRGGALVHLGGDDDYNNPNNPYYFPKDYKGGASVAAGTGISWAREDSETYLSFGYRYARTSYTQNNYNDIPYTYKSNYNRLEVKFGFKF